MALGAATSRRQGSRRRRGTGGNLISPVCEHMWLCMRGYNRLAELSEQICTRVVVETRGKCAARNRGSATTARFMRITLFDVEKFHARNIRVTSSSSSRDFTADRYRTLAACSGASLTWLSNARHTRSVGMIRCCCIGIHELLLQFIRSRSNIFTINICKVFSIHLYQMLLRV